MSILRHDAPFERLDKAALAAWAEIPPAIASDCMNRSQAMSAAIKPLAPGTRLTGQARTVACMVGDNGAIHAAITSETDVGELLMRSTCQAVTAIYIPLPRREIA